MNKRFSPAMIGAFVLGAVILIVIAILVFGSGRLFRQTRTFVLYFDSSVNGLRMGAPVKLKGVEIGSVKDIRIQVGQGTGADEIPVIIEIDLKKLTRRGAPAAAEATVDPEAMQKVIVDRGLRGQLDMESLVTGLLYVALDFFPGTPINFVQKPGGDYDYPEIPTLPTTLEQAKGALTRVISKLEDIDFKELDANLQATLKGVNRTVNSPEIESVLRSLARVMPKVDQAVVNIRNLAGTMDDKVKILADDLQHTSADARLALKQAGDALKQTQETMKRAEGAVANIETLSDLDSPVNYELVKGLRDVSTAARSLRALTDYLERNPRAPIFGKPDGKEN
jgi:phospholipid/cholesterol/gamma-HCH transport system substrate-binding protein